MHNGKSPIARLRKIEQMSEDRVQVLHMDKPGTVVCSLCLKPFWLSRWIINEGPPPVCNAHLHKPLSAYEQPVRGWYVVKDRI